ncbi:MAG: hypothetical protein ACYCXN_08460 [Acidimicrobiales bacterium]|jgi:hypothetical protein
MHPASRREAAIAGEVVVVVDRGAPGVVAFGVVVVVPAVAVAGAVRATPGTEVGVVRPGTDVGGDDAFETFRNLVVRSSVPA